MGSAVHSKPGLNLPFADRLVSVQGPRVSER